MQQLEIYWVDLDPARGVKTQKVRPCVILQGNQANHHSQQCVIAPLLPGHRAWPFVINIDPDQRNKLDKARHINLKQLKGMDRERFGNRHGRLDKRYLSDIHEGMKRFFEMDGYLVH